MVGPIESVTIAVPAMDPARRLLRDEHGLTEVIAGRASVGLLSAWRYPVHESVRLLELAYSGAPYGRVRLALYEDALPDEAQRDSGEQGGTAPWAGPRALDFRTGTTTLAGPVVQNVPEFPPIISGARGGTARVMGPVGSIWIVTAEEVRAGQFYTHALGYQVSKESEITVEDSASCWQALGLAEGSRLQLTLVGCRSESAGRILLVRLLDGAPRRRPPRLGARGINLLTCRCEDLDELIARLKAFEIEPVAAPAHVGMPDGRPARVMVAYGPSGEALEFVEIEPAAP